MHPAHYVTELSSILETVAQSLTERRTAAEILRLVGELLIERACELEAAAEATAVADRRAFMHLVPDPGRHGRLTGREREVAARIAQGQSNRQIGEALVITNSTVERHVANILGKLGMRSRAQVAVWAVRLGLSIGESSGAGRLEGVHHTD